jgi:hypothetical protein
MFLRVLVAMFLVTTFMGGGAFMYEDLAGSGSEKAPEAQAKWVSARPKPDTPAAAAPQHSAPKTQAPKEHTDLRRFLPPARDGWTRFEWNDYADAQLTRAGVAAGDGSHDTAASGRRLTSDEAIERAFRAQGTWVYAGPGKVLSIRAVHSGREYKGGGLRDPNALTEDIDAKNRLFAEIRGVRFYETADKAWQGQPAPYRFYKAWLGNGVTLTVRARADDATVRGYLRQIDYDGILAERAGKAPKTAGIPLLSVLFGGRDAGPAAPEPAAPKVRINRGLGAD